MAFRAADRAPRRMDGGARGFRPGPRMILRPARRRVGLAAAGALLVLAAAGPAAAQSQQGGGAVAARLQALEAEIRRLNGRIEELEFRLRRVAEDGGLRLSDLDFRVTELEGGDLSLLGAPTPLGEAPGTGGGTADAPSGPPTPESDRVALADARALLDAGDPEAARGRLLGLLSAAPDGPLTPEAEYWLGMSEMALGDARAAAQTFLTTVDAYPNGPRAAESLLMLGRALQTLGATEEACDTFAEVAGRHPAHPAAVEAEAERDALACP